MKPNITEKYISSMHSTTEGNMHSTTKIYQSTTHAAHK
jgi:hypothetical protein